MSDYNSKKEQFMNKQKSKTSLLLLVFLLVSVSIVLSIFIINSKKESKEYFGEPVFSSRSYAGEIISATSIEPTIENEKIIIPLNIVDEKNIISFELENDQDFLVPLMVYVTPSGRLFGGSSMCEPCRGRSYSIKEDTLLCDICGTTYDIETHTFISGSPVCGMYPPANMNARIEDGRIIIDLKEVLEWRLKY